MKTYDDLIVDLARFAGDPLGFVHWAFPWSEPNTDLALASGPEQWQAEILGWISEGLLTPNEAIRVAVTSGHGVGKSALVAWIVLWAISTCTDTRGVVTANTENQLKTKTWVELATWYRRFIGRELFKLTATAIFSADPEHERTWRIDMVPWSERNTEAFAGLHNKGRRIILIKDEASAIPDMIWEVSEGALTDKDTEILDLNFGNPTRNKGRFRECFPGGRYSHRWRTMTVDSRSVSFTNKEQIQSWIDDYGEDTDFVRVRVLGKFPRVDAESFISLPIAQDAVGRQVGPQGGNALILGVDVGRFGDDPTVIYPRRGRDASTHLPRVYYGLDLMRQAAEIAAVFNELRADVCMIDGGGVGGGVIDRLRQLTIPVIEVQFGSKADQSNIINTGVKYSNKRAEIWGAMRDWLTDGSIVNFSIASLSGSPITLVDELTGPTYGLTPREEILLESKKDMRSRGVASPNVADALACTFAVPTFIPRSVQIASFHKPKEYDPFDLERIYAS